MPKAQLYIPRITKRRRQEITKRYGFKSDFPLHVELNNALGFYFAIKRHKTPTTRSKSAVYRRILKTTEKLSEDIEHLSNSNPEILWYRETLENQLAMLRAECLITLKNIAELKKKRKKKNHSDTELKSLARSDHALILLLSYLRQIWVDGTGKPAPKSINTWPDANPGLFFKFCEEVLLLVNVKKSKGALAKRLDRLCPIKIYGLTTIQGEK